MIAPRYVWAKLKSRPGGKPWPWRPAMIFDDELYGIAVERSFALEDYDIGADLTPPGEDAT